ncbi:hypothetical protein [Caulobacter sp. RL271]|uniref:Uncharacterized protein n=1 Tax=Caulobacter segnis TaxID=88688 RepID=A0ABY4ZXM3_9CAUL|nr:hypothetical protein [Caulobacter segnis]USQ97255.1 hypothetical protein MZV50_06850 [Caulobacter segnis]
MEVRLYPKDERLARFENALAALSEGGAAKVMARALNHEGDKKRTQVQRKLAEATGLRYRDIAKAIRTVRATKGRLEYKLEFNGRETNLNVFQARQTKQGVSAAPWGVRRIFPHTFIVAKYGGRVFKRTGEASKATRYKLMDYGHKGHGRLPIRQVYGPNLAREVLKGEPIEAWEANHNDLIDRVGHEIERELIAEMTGIPMGSWAG